MADDILHQGPTAEVAPVEEVQPSTEAPNEGVADGTGAPAQEQETEAQAAERIVQERRVRQQRAAKNQEAAFARLAAKNDELTRALMEAVKRGSPQQSQPEAPADKAPSREDFDSWEAYEDARVEYKLEQKLAKQTEKQAKELAELIQRSQAQQREQSLHSEHVQRTVEFARSVPDFEAVTDRDDIEVPPAAVEAIKSVPNGPAVVYAMGRDPSLAYRLQNMGPTQQAAFVGQISASLMQRNLEVSQAPAPGKPVGTRSASAPTLETANYDEFVKLRRKQIAARR